MSHYAIRRALATLAGLAVISAETVINISHVNTPGQHWLSQPLVIAVGLTGAAQAIAMMVLADAWSKRRPILAITTALGLIAAVAFTASTTYERTASARETRRIDASAPAATAAARITALQTIRDAECTARGPKCRQRETDLADAKIAAAPIASARSSHLGAFEMLPELALPAMLMLLGFAFIAYSEGASGADTAPAPVAHSFPDPDTIPDNEKEDARRIFQPDRKKTTPANRLNKRTAIEAYVITETALGRPIPSQKSLIERFDCPRSTVSDILADMERSGLIVRRMDGRQKMIAGV